MHPHARLNSQKAGSSPKEEEEERVSSVRLRGGLTFTGGWPERTSRRGGVLEGLYWINSIHQIALALCRITPELSSNPRAVSAVVSLWQNGAKDGDEVLAGLARLKFVTRLGGKRGRMVMPATRTLFSLIHQRTVGAKLHYYVPLHEPLSSSPLLQFSFPDVDENFTRG